MPSKRSRKRANKSTIAKKTCQVHSVYDGDTLSVEWEHSAWWGLKKDVQVVKVRLAYIDTPELRSQEAGAQHAKAVLEKLLAGKRVVLEYEQLSTGRPRKGDYHRVLAVVYLQRTFLPNMNINELLLKRGLARLYSHPDNITPYLKKRLVRAETFAKSRKLGVWRFDEHRHDDHESSRVFWHIAIGIIIGILIGIALVE